MLAAQPVKDLFRRDLRRPLRGKVVPDGAGRPDPASRAEPSGRSAGRRRRDQHGDETTPIRNPERLALLDAPKGCGGPLLKLSDTDRLHVLQV